MTITSLQTTTGTGTAPYVTLNANGDYVVGDASYHSVGSMKVWFVGTGWTGSVVIQARPAGSGLAAGKAIPYRRLHVAAAASDNTYVSAAITADAVIAVELDGDELILSYTHTGGSCQVFLRPLTG